MSYEMRKALLGIEGVVAVVIEGNQANWTISPNIWVEGKYSRTDLYESIVTSIHMTRPAGINTEGEITRRLLGTTVQEQFTLHTLEEGCLCPDCSIGELVISQEQCYCSATSQPPCSSCEHSIVACDNCGTTLEEILDSKEENGSMAIPKLEVKTFMSGDWVGGNTGPADKTAQILSNQKEETKMTQLNRKQVTVTLIDNDANLPANKAIVFTKDIISDGNKEDIIREVLFSENIVEALFAHNKIRKTIVDEGILERVGNEVKLRAVELKDLTWNVA